VPERPTWISFALASSTLWDATATARSKSKNGARTVSARLPDLAVRRKPGSAPDWLSNQRFRAARCAGDGAGHERARSGRAASRSGSDAGFRRAVRIPRRWGDRRIMHYNAYRVTAATRRSSGGYCVSATASGIQNARTETSVAQAMPRIASSASSALVVRCQSKRDIRTGNPSVCPMITPQRGQVSSACRGRRSCAIRTRPFLL
jgi:hypothetical protein